MRFFALFLTLQIQLFTETCQFKDFDPFQYELSKRYVSEKITECLQYSREIERYYEIQKDGFALYASPRDKAKGIVEYKLFFRQESPGEIVKKKKRFQLNKPLNQAKIAIDPGHFGGDFSRLEERYVEAEYEGRILSFNEGTLAFLTALHLKNRLEKEGASVMLTRRAIGEGAYPENFFDWLKRHPELWEKGVSLSSIFCRHYNRLDLRERAKIINEYRPDLTVIIHYNAIESEKANSNQTKLTHRNFNLIFIPGAFCKGELKTLEDRYHFLRLICTEDLENSYLMAKEFVKFFTLHLQVPSLKRKEEKRGFANSLPSIDGVFYRNLLLTRLVKTPLCYGETLIQNDLQEALKLNQINASVSGIPCSQRVIDVANAYFEVIASFFEGNKDKTL